MRSPLALLLASWKLLRKAKSTEEAKALGRDVERPYRGLDGTVQYDPEAYDPTAAPSEIRLDPRAELKDVGVEGIKSGMPPLEKKGREAPFYRGHL